MAMQVYSSPAQRIGKLKGRILKHWAPMIVLGKVGVKDDFDRNKGDTVIYRRWLPKGSTTASPNTWQATETGDRVAAYANAHLADEGVTPAAETLTPQDITATLQQYVVLFGYTDKTADLYEDDVPAEMTEQVGERLALVQELVLYGQLKGCTNKFYGGTGTSRVTVNGKITLSLLRKITRSLDANHCKKVTKMVMPTQGFGSTSVEPGYPVFIHTDLKPDIRDLPLFKPYSDYGKTDASETGEFGKCEEFRFFASPELAAIQGESGVTAAVTTAGCENLQSVGGSYIDVYQVIVGSREAWGHIGLKGSSEVKVIDVPPNKTDKADPVGQRGYIGAKVWYNAVILNNLQMACVEVGTSSL